jgi:hypothetical protein
MWGLAHIFKNRQQFFPVSASATCLHEKVSAILA